MVSDNGSVLSTVESCKEQQSVERKHPTAKQNKLSPIKKKKKQSVERRHPLISKTNGDI